MKMEHSQLIHNFETKDKPTNKNTILCRTISDLNETCRIVTITLINNLCKLSLLIYSDIQIVGTFLVLKYLWLIFINKKIFSKSYTSIFKQKTVKNQYFLEKQAECTLWLHFYHFYSKERKISYFSFIDTKLERKRFWVVYKYYCFLTKLLLKILWKIKILWHTNMAEIFRFFLHMSRWHLDQIWVV